MEWNKQTIKNLLLIVCGGIAFYCLLQNLGFFIRRLGWLKDILMPFILGGALAFVVNVPMRAIERHMGTGGGKGAKLRRPVALILTLVALCGVLTLAVNVIGPGVTEAAVSALDQLPAAMAELEARFAELESYLPQLEAFVFDLDIEWDSLSKSLIGILKNWSGRLLSTGGGFIGGVVSGVSTFVIGLIFALYILLQKEKLARQGRQVCYGLLPERWADRTLEIVRMAGRTFANFLSGQCLEAVILGTLFVVVMTIFRMPYALLVGVLIALLSLIPIVGAFIGCGVGALLIALTDPWKALLFVVLFLVLQQIEGNLIYPHVVGSSVGLPSIWVLAAVTLGGKLMGVLGMLIFIPLCSVLYALFRGYVKKRLVQRNVPEGKWKDPPETKKE